MFGNMNGGDATRLEKAEMAKFCRPSIMFAKGRFSDGESCLRSELGTASVRVA